MSFFFLFHDLFEEDSLHLVVMSPQAPLGWAVSQTSHGFDGLSSFEEYWSAIL